MNDRVHGVVVLGVRRSTVDQFFGLGGNSTNGMATYGVGIVINTIVDEWITDGILIGGTLWNGNDIPNVVGATLGGVGYILLVGVVGFDDGTAIVAFSVAIDGI